MNQVAESCVAAETALGLDSYLCNVQSPPEDSFESILNSDIHVIHTHFPTDLRKRAKKDHKYIYVSHGTPEHIFSSSVVDGLKSGYGHGDSWMLFQYNLQHADAVVTFWPRHQKIIQSLCDKRTQVHCLPMGVETAFWVPGESTGKFSGSPSLLTAENCHDIKWPLDLFLTWPWVYPALPDNPCLHAAYLPTDKHRWFFPLVNRNGCSFASHLSSGCFDKFSLRNAFRSVDYYIGLVRYGDFNRISLEANSTGCKTISYRGNPYSDFWLTEGDQRDLAAQLTAILLNQVEPRQKSSVPDISLTAQSMLSLYESL